MGTAALFFVNTEDDNRHWRFCLGMTSDGFPPNLRWVAERYTAIQKSLHLTNNQARKATNVKRIFDLIDTQTNGAIFHEPDHRNSDWIYHSGVWNPTKKTLTLYEGNRENFVRTQKLRNRQWTTLELNEFADPSSYTGYCA